MFKYLVILVLVLFGSLNIFAENIYNAAVYGGYLYNEIESDEETADDSNYMGGIFVQMINTEYFQFNDFVYGSKDINDSDIIGNHLIFDFYPIDFPFGKTVIGAGVDYINVKTETEFIELENEIWAFYGRIGQYLDYNLNENIKISLLPWIGYEYEKVKTEGTMNLVIPPMMIEMDVDLDDEDTDYYLMTGINLGIDYSHFLQVKLKYSRKYEVEEKEYPNSYSAMINVFFSRHVGLSYRFKQMDVQTGMNRYNMLGLMVTF